MTNQVLQPTLDHEDVLKALQATFPNLAWRSSVARKGYGAYWAVFAKHWELRIDVFPTGSMATLYFGNYSGKQQVISSGTEPGKTLEEVIAYTRARWDEIQAQITSAMAPTKNNHVAIVKQHTLIIFENYLKQEGFNVNSIGGSCQFEIEANHKSGISIYFWIRPFWASFEVYDRPYFLGDLPNDKCLLSTERWALGDFDGGWVNYSDAFYVFWMMWQDVKHLVGE